MDASPASVLGNWLSKKIAVKRLGIQADDFSERFIVVI
jgi:hypothetical protein